MGKASAATQTGTSTRDDRAGRALALRRAPAPPTANIIAIGGAGEAADDVRAR